MELSTCQKKSRILCLHGYRQSAKTFKAKLGALRKLLKTDVEFHFLDAPLVVSWENDERSWWFTQDNSTFSSKHSDSCFGFETSLESVKNICQKEGPFDGLLGFSQGGAFAAILCSLKIEELQVSFVILIAAFKSLSTSHSCYYNDICTTPSLHVIGKSDSVISPALSEELCEHYLHTSRRTLYHEGGHYIPANKQVLQNYLSFILEYSQ